VEEHPGSAVLRVTADSAGKPLWKTWGWKWDQPPDWAREALESRAAAAAPRGPQTAAP